MFQRILVVCVGNICRSPTAEYLLRDRLAGRGPVVASAGLAALAGHAMDATAQEVLAARGVAVGAHRARQLTSAMLREADLVCAMEQRHLAGLIRMAPEASGKLMMLTRWRGGHDIPDPYRQPREVFERTCDMIQNAIEGWLPYLQGGATAMEPTES